MNQPYIQPELFAFFRDLRENNDRDWFQANKKRYEAHVKIPLQQFIRDFAAHLETISPHYIADPRGNGGSLFRIYRDVRFSKDKSPYKTSAGLHFRHEKGKDVHAPGFYLHLEPGSVFAGVGIWHPENKTLNKIRDAIVADPNHWREMMSNKAFSDAFSLGGESLKRAPKGYDLDHPLIEDIRRKDFIASAEFSEADACQPDFIKRFTESCRTASPFMEFLTTSIGLAW